MTRLYLTSLGVDLGFSGEMRGLAAQTQCYAFHVSLYGTIVSQIISCGSAFRSCTDDLQLLVRITNPGEPADTKLGNQYRPALGQSVTRSEYLFDSILRLNQKFSLL